MRLYAKVLIGVALVLTALGLVVLASAGNVRAGAAFGDPNYFINRQLVWAGIALLAGLVLARCDYHVWQRMAVPVYAAGVLLLILTLVPGIGVRIKGSARWLNLGPMSLQPSELAKFSTVVALSAWLAWCGRRVKRFREGLLVPLLLLGAPVGLVFLSPDFGTTFLMGLVGGALLWAGGTRLSYLATTGFAGLCAFVVAAVHDPIRWARLAAFLFPDKHPDVYYHLMQSKIAFRYGGPFGVGLGNSLQKQHYLPEAHTDFIFAIIGEEMGIVFTVLVVLLFATLLVCGLAIGLRTADPFGKLLAFGLTMTLSLQAMINIGVVTGCLPTTGIALPFISYGGTSLVVSVAQVATLVNIAWHDEADWRKRKARVVKNRLHRF